jgi:Cupredoxin-like domain
VFKRKVYGAVIAIQVIAVLALGIGSIKTQAQDAMTIWISIKNHRFQPSEIKAPAKKALKLTIKNLDSTPTEFESVSLHVEKVIAGNSEGIINLRPLAPGRYKFFDDFHPGTAKGILIVQ